MMQSNPDAEQFAKTIQIGEMRFGETTTPSFPGITSSPSPQSVSSFTLKPTVVSLDEARTMLPFGFLLPAWIPDGFILEPEVRITLPVEELRDDTDTMTFRFAIPPASMASLDLMWRHADGRFIGLTIHPTQLGSEHKQGTIAIPPDAVVALQVHQRPAALITHQYAFTPPDHHMQISDIAVLRWHENNKQNELRTRTQDVSVDELLRIANSIRE